ncbi:hypothetical protein BJY52DRAFT_1225700 [Lactarius psammicola]|nr:hypothetical protein BJY52DRAFT_1225700 [Lactarius psammicola]
MDSLFSFVLSLIFLCQAVDVAMALPIPPSFKRAPHLEAPGAVVLEMGFYSIFTMALLFSLLGAYMMKVMGGTRTPAFMARLPRGATLHQTINRLPSLLLALDSRGTQRRIPVRRGRLSAPMATLVVHDAWRMTSPSHILFPYSLQVISPIGTMMRSALTAMKFSFVPSPNDYPRTRFFVAEGYTDMLGGDSRGSS